MKQMLLYYKLIILNSISIVITMLCGMVMMIKKIDILGSSKLFIWGCSIPIIIGILFLLLDVTFVCNWRDIEDINLGKYEQTYRRGRKKLTTAQLLILKNVNAISLLAIFVSALMIFFMKSISLTEGIIAYSLTLIVSLFHYYSSSKRS